jgi:hypothetical protein
VRTIADSLGILAWTVRSALLEKIGCKNVLRRWIPHRLTGELRVKRVKLAGQLLRALESQQRPGFHNIVADNESWFLQHYD